MYSCWGSEGVVDLSAIWKVFEEYTVAEATGSYYELSEESERDVWRRRSKFVIFD